MHLSCKCASEFAPEGQIRLQLAPFLRTSRRDWVLLRVSRPRSTRQFSGLFLPQQGIISNTHPYGIEANAAGRSACPHTRAQQQISTKQILAVTKIRTNEVSEIEKSWIAEGSPLSFITAQFRSVLYKYRIPSWGEKKKLAFFFAGPVKQHPPTQAYSDLWSICCPLEISTKFKPLN